MSVATNMVLCMLASDGSSGGARRTYLKNSSSTSTTLAPINLHSLSTSPKVTNQSTKHMAQRLVIPLQSIVVGTLSIVYDFQALAKSLHSTTN